MDAITFDGSCTPNPGGCMGLGWVVTLQNNSFSILGNDRLEKDNSNSALFAEYLALKKAMLEYVRAEGQGPLVVMGDSQTVIYQLRGIYPVMNDDIWNVYRDIVDIIRQYELDIHFKWVPRAQNQHADRLSKTKGKVRILYPDDREFAMDVTSAPVSGNLRQRIARMNSTPFPPGSMFRDLHTASRDILSDKALSELQEMAGDKAVRMVAEAFPGKAGRSMHYQAQALRWMLRGLAMDLAVQKVRFDTQSKKKSTSSSAGKVKCKNPRSGKKPKSSGAKYYVNRRSYAF